MTIEEFLERIKNISISKTKEKKYFDELNRYYVYPHKMDFSSYKDFVPIVLAFNEDYFSEIHIRHFALKLMYAFGTTTEAIAYLKRYFKDRQAYRLSHACTFELPREYWDVKLWQQIITYHQPNNPEDKIFRLFVYANHIEEHFKKNKDEMLKDTKTFVLQEFERKFSTKFATASLSKEQWLEQQFQKKHKAIEKEINYEFDHYLQNYLSKVKNFFSPSQKINFLEQRRKNLSDDDLIVKNSIHTKIMAMYNKKFENNYDKFEHTLLSKEEYIAHQFENSKNEINEVIAQQATYLIFPKISLDKIFMAAASQIYSRANENLQAAELFFKFKQLNNTFEHYLSLKPKDDPKRIPNIFLDGKTIAKEYEQYYLAKLSPFDPRAALLGFYTSCCQKLSDLNGCAPTEHGITSTHGGFYVVFKKKPDWINLCNEDLIIAQCWAWNVHHNLVFDSVEMHINYQKKPIMICDFFTLLADQLVKNHSFSQVLVGIDEVCGTPPNLGTAVYSGTLQPYHYEKKNYRDSDEMRLIASKTDSSLIETYKSKNPESALNKKLLLLSSPAAFFSEKNTTVAQETNSLENINRNSFMSS